LGQLMHDIDTPEDVQQFCDRHQNNEDQGGSGPISTSSNVLDWPAVGGRRISSSPDDDESNNKVSNDHHHPSCLYTIQALQELGLSTGPSKSTGSVNRTVKKYRIVQPDGSVVISTQPPPNKQSTSYSIHYDDVAPKKKKTRLVKRVVKKYRIVQPDGSVVISTQPPNSNGAPASTA
jgi:hypothetical protein